MKNILLTIFIIAIFVGCGESEMHSDINASNQITDAQVSDPIIATSVPELPFMANHPLNEIESN